MPTEFKLPELGEGVDSADVSRVYVSEGDTIEADDNVMELETEKAVADLPCPHSGKITKIRVSEGDTIEVGQTLLSIEEVSEKESREDTPSDSGEEKNQEEQKQEEQEEKEPAHEQSEKDKAKKQPEDEAEDREEAAEEERPELEEQTRTVTAEKEKREPKSTESDGKHRPPPAGPATRRLARKLEVDLESLRPDDGDRITQMDVVQAYTEGRKAAALWGISREPLPDFSIFGAVERQPLGKIQQTSAERLAASWQTIPHVTQHGSTDFTEVETARREYMDTAGEDTPKITLTAIAVNAATSALREFPKFNSSYDAENGELILKQYFHIGVAVDTEHGLVVPVIRDCDQKSIRDIAGELTDLAQRARYRKLGREQMQGGTFTISNQGGIGGDHFTPIINYPEVAILGLGRARQVLELIDGKPQQRLRLPLSLSYDHRVINGADAARFIERLQDLMSQVVILAIET